MCNIFSSMEKIFLDTSSAKFQLLYHSSFRRTIHNMTFVEETDHEFIQQLVTRGVLLRRSSGN